MASKDEIIESNDRRTYYCKAFIILDIIASSIFGFLGFGVFAGNVILYCQKLEFGTDSHVYGCKIFELRFQND